MKPEFVTPILRDLSLEHFFYVDKVDYDEVIEVSIPYYDIVHAELLRSLPFATDRPLPILDLGTGTGKTLAMIMERYPNATATAVDLFDTMLERARIRLEGLGRLGRAVDYIQTDMRTIDFSSGAFDLIFSVLAIHHLSHSEKRRLFRSIAKWLAPGGIFALGDWTSFAAPNAMATATRVAEDFIDGIAAAGKIPPTTALEWKKHWREVNLPATVEDQMRWLREAGFATAENVFRYHGMALIVAER